MRLPTGEFDGRHASVSGLTTRIRSGSICKHFADDGADQRLVALP